MQDTRRDTSRDDADDLPDGRWLSYAELAKLRGIDRASAFKLALRHKWRRQKNNQGQVTVFVPSDFTDREDESQDNGYDASHHVAAFETALVAIREAHAGEVAALRSQLQSVTAERDRSQDASHQAEARADELMGRLDQAAAEAIDQRIAAETARVALEQARSEARQARKEAEALRQAQDMSYDRANAAAIEEAEQVNVRLVSLEADLRARDAEAVEQRQAAAQAQEAARVAEEAAEALRQAEEARKGRGRLRRAWDGWRGK